MSLPPESTPAPAQPGAAPGSSGHGARIIALIGTGHFLSHFYMLCLPPLFLAWRAEFDVSYATLGLSVALMAATTAALQTPVGFAVDRYGARPFLIGGALLMALSVAAMAFAPSFWVVLPLAVLSGVGNSVIHPADYAIMAGSVDKSFMGRAFALHSFTGNLGFAFAPPVIALLLGVMDWRMAVLTVGLAGVPVVAMILAQSGILRDQAKPERKADAPAGRALLLSRPMLLFFAFFLLSSMAGSGIQAWLVTVLDQLWGTPVLAASAALTGYMAGNTGGNLIGGWIADKSKRNLMTLVTVLTLLAMAVLLALGLVALPEPVLIVTAVIGGLALGISRTPRDVMLKDACPPGEIGKVFGFVSSSLPLGSAIVPVPMGLLIDLGYPGLVLPVVAGLLGLSLLCAGGARETRRAGPATAAMPAE
jgi:FSR family fosmidomycin resistance protein-like MFS transporter